MTARIYEIKSDLREDFKSVIPELILRDEFVSWEVSIILGCITVK